MSGDAFVFCWHVVFCAATSQQSRKTAFVPGCGTIDRLDIEMVLNDAEDDASAVLGLEKLYEVSESHLCQCEAVAVAAVQLCCAIIRDMLGKADAFQAANVFHMVAGEQVLVEVEESLRISTVEVGGKLEERVNENGPKQLLKLGL